jgi:hypothetical protein
MSQARSVKTIGEPYLDCNAKTILLAAACLPYALVSRATAGPRWDQSRVRPDR